MFLLIFLLDIHRDIVCNAQGFSLIAMVFARGRYQSGVVQQKAVFVFDNMTLARCLLSKQGCSK